MKLWLTISGSASVSSSFDPPGVAFWILSGATEVSMGSWPGGSACHSASGSGRLRRADRFGIWTGRNTVVRFADGGWVDIAVSAVGRR